MGHAMEQNRPRRRGRSVAAIVSLVTVAATVLVGSAGTATGETPAERCARETSAYNATWESTWRASNPGNTGPPPPPPVPYVCHDPGEPTTTTSTPPPTAPGLQPTQAPGAGVQGQAGNAPGSLPQGDGTDIVPGPTSPSLTQPATRPSPPVTTRPVRKPADDVSDEGSCGNGWNGPPCANIQECPPGYSIQGNLCFGVLSITPGVVPEGSQPKTRQKNCTSSPAKWTKNETWTSSSTITNTNSKMESTQNTVGGSVKVEGEGGVPLIGSIKATVEGNYQNQQKTDTTWIDTNTQQQTLTDSSSKEFTVAPGKELTVYTQYTDVSWEIVQKYSHEKVTDGHTYIAEPDSYGAFESPANCTPPGR